jgi:biofilm PGA synthesis N-glycosyltransferase PgaC
MIRCTIGVMAYNEERNIVQVLYALLNQSLYTCHMVEIVVVASGCTDRTVALAQEVAQDNPIIRVEVQAKRAGKAAAINHLITVAQGDVIVLVGADTLPDPAAIEYLARPFADPTVGMTGARVIPLNDPRTFLGLIVQMLWRVHHHLALRFPKLGELVAFRNVVQELPLNSATDEVALEALISAQGYRLVYTPDAIVYNRGPQTYNDFLLQRRRIFAGHLHIAATKGYIAASMPVKNLLWLAYEGVMHRPDLLIMSFGAMLLECVGRALGWLDFHIGQSHHIWRQIRSTKQIQHYQQGGSLLCLQCKPDSFSPRHLMQSMYRIPPAYGILFWWDYRRSQVMFLLPDSQLSDESLEDRVRILTDYLKQPNNASSYPVIFYRTVRFAELYQSTPSFSGQVQEVIPSLL